MISIIVGVIALGVTLLLVGYRIPEKFYKRAALFGLNRTQKELIKKLQIESLKYRVESITVSEKLGCRLRIMDKDTVHSDGIEINYDDLGKVPALETNLEQVIAECEDAGISRWRINAMR